MKQSSLVSVKLLSALHVNGGTDASGNRTTIKMDGRAYIPATLFKGLVRENFSKLSTELFPDWPVCTRTNRYSEKKCDCAVCSMFGSAGFQKSRVYFDNLESDQNLRYEIRTNVAIDRYTRKALDKALVFSEAVSACAETSNGGSEPTVFEGEVEAYYPQGISEEKQKQIETLLIESVKLITNIGLGKSRGLGFVETSISLKEVQSE